MKFDVNIEIDDAVVDSLTDEQVDALAVEFRTGMMMSVMRLRDLARTSNRRASELASLIQPDGGKPHASVASRKSKLASLTFRVQIEKGQR